MDDTLKRRLQQVLASYGVDPARWPADERGALQACLDQVPDQLSEAAMIDGLLDLAEGPSLPAGSQTRLLARIAGAAPTVILPLARPAARRPRLLPWTAALPLAASLALGIYLGANGEFDSLLPTAITGDSAAGDDDGDLSGVAVVTDYAEEQAS